MKTKNRMTELENINRRIAELRPVADSDREKARERMLAWFTRATMTIEGIITQAEQIGIAANDPTHPLYGMVTDEWDTAWGRMNDKMTEILTSALIVADAIPSPLD